MKILFCALKHRFLIWRSRLTANKCVSNDQLSIKTIRDWVSKTPEILEPLWFFDTPKTVTNFIMCRSSEEATISNRVPPLASYRTPFERKVLPCFSPSKTDTISAVCVELPQTSEPNRLASQCITSVEPSYFESNPNGKDQGVVV